MHFPHPHYSLALFLTAVFSVTVHELGHAASALAFGDDTAKRAGRITLNPWKVSPFGAVLLPGLLVLAGGYPVAFASTPVNPSRMRKPRLHSTLCSLAGPGVNIVLIGVSILVLRGQAARLLPLGLEYWPFGYLLAFALGYVNVILAVFNLIPVPPLDGSALVEHFLPPRYWQGWAKFRQYGFGILFLVLFLGHGLLTRILAPFVNLWFSAWAPGAGHFI